MKLFPFPQVKNSHMRHRIYNYLKYQENIKQFSLNSLRAYGKDLQFLTPDQPPFHPDDLSKPPPEAEKQGPETGLDAQELLVLIRKEQNGWTKLSPATKNRKAACLKSFSHYLYDQKIIDTDIAVHIHCPKVPKKIPHFISVDEVIAIIENLEKQEMSILRSSHSAEEKSRQLAENFRSAALFSLLYGCGLRVGEACEMKKNQIQFAQKILRVKGKGGKERLTVMTTFTITALKKLLRVAVVPDSDSIWGRAPLNTRTAYEMIRQMGRRTELQSDLHPHALRHSFATHLLSSGANLRTLQELLGHSSLTATEKYTHLSMGQLAQTMNHFHPFGNKVKRSR